MSSGAPQQGASNAACLAGCPTDGDPHTHMVNLIYGFIRSQTVRAFAELRLADHLAGGALTAREIAERVDASPLYVGRLLRSGIALGLVSHSRTDAFEGTDLLATLRGEATRSLRALAMAQTSASLWTAWTEFVPSVRAGSSQAHRALGDDFFSYLGRHPEEAAGFSAAMSNATSVWSDNIAEVIDTSAVRRAVDVGGASGSLLQLLQEANSELHGVVFDRAEVLDHARSVIDSRGFSDRTTLVAGDFFAAAPVADLYLLKFILHDWDDEHCIEILRRCREAMSPDGRVAVVEYLWDPVYPSEITAMADMLMLMMLSGRERSLGEFDALFDAAGLRRTSVRPTRHPQVVIEAMAI